MTPAPTHLLCAGEEGGRAVRPERQRRLRGHAVVLPVSSTVGKRSFRSLPWEARIE